MKKSNIKLLSAINFCMGFQPYRPLFAIYLAGVLGTFTEAMFIMSISSIFASVMEVPSGWIADFLGRKRSMIVNTAFFLIALVIYATGGSFWWLLLGAFFDGVSLAMGTGSDEALLYESLLEKGEEKKYGYYLGRFYAAMYWGLAISSAFAILVFKWPVSYLIWAAVVVHLIGLFISFFLHEPEVKAKHDENIYVHLKNAVANFLKNGQVRGLALAQIFNESLRMSASQMYSIFYKSLVPEFWIGPLRAWGYVVTALGRQTQHWLEKRSWWTTTIGVDMIKRGVDLLCLIFPGPWSPVLMNTASYTNGVTDNAVQSNLQKQLSPTGRATMRSLVNLAANVMYFLGAMLVGWLADNWSARLACIVIEILLIGVWIIYWYIGRKQKLSLRPSGQVNQ